MLLSEETHKKDTLTLLLVFFKNGSLPNVTQQVRISKTQTSENKSTNIALPVHNLVVPQLGIDHNHILKKYFL